MRCKIFLPVNYLYYADYDSGSIIARSTHELSEKIKKKFPETTKLNVDHYLGNRNTNFTTLDVYVPGEIFKPKVFSMPITIGRMAAKNFNLSPTLPRITFRHERLFPIFTKTYYQIGRRKIWNYFVLCSEYMVVRITDDGLYLASHSNKDARKYFGDEYLDASYEEVAFAAEKSLKSVAKLLKEPILAITRWNCLINNVYYIQFRDRYLRLSGEELQVITGTHSVQDKDRGTGTWKYCDAPLIDAAFVLDHLTKTICRLLQYPNRKYENWGIASEKQ